MTLMKFEPLREFEGLSNRIQKMFGEFPAFGRESGFTFSPRIDVAEDEKHIFIEAEIPGVTKDDIKISLQDNIISINGEKKQTDEKKEKNFYRCERVYGSFSRSFTLPAEVNPDKVKAKFENGILNIEIEKVHPKERKEKLIDIK